MVNRVIHQKYLEAWLRGEDIQIDALYGDNWCDFTIRNIKLIDSVNYKFRMKPKAVEVTEDLVVVSLTDFYAEYDKITSMEISYEGGYDKLVTLIKKYLLRY